jgi:hypothetical protein
LAYNVPEVNAAVGEQTTDPVEIFISLLEYVFAPLLKKPPSDAIYK